MLPKFFLLKLNVTLTELRYGQKKASMCFHQQSLLNPSQLFTNEQSMFCNWKKWLRFSYMSIGRRKSDIKSQSKLWIAAIESTPFSLMKKNRQTNISRAVYLTINLYYVQAHPL